MELKFRLELNLYFALSINNNKCSIFFLLCPLKTHLWQKIKVLCAYFVQFSQSVNIFGI